MSDFGSTAWAQALDSQLGWKSPNLVCRACLVLLAGQALRYLHQSTHLLVCLPTYLRSTYLCTYLSLSVYVYLPLTCPSNRIYLFECVSIYLSTHLSMCRSIYRSICVSIPEKLLACMYICILMNVYIHLNIHTCVYLYRCTYISHVCVYRNVYIYKYTYVSFAYTYTYAHIHVHIRLRIRICPI